MSNLDIGIHFVVEPEGPVLTEREKETFRKLKPLGVMFRKRNFLSEVSYSEWLDAYRHLVEDIRNAIGRERVVFSIDHEGGRVVRPPQPITCFPYAARWSDCAFEVAEAMAIEIKSLGINVNFGPVTDIHSNPENPVINERAFGRTSAEVISSVIPFVEAFERHNVLCCAKHFPGHGDTKTDSHWSLPVVDAKRDELADRELKPFKALIDWGIPLIMTAHVVYPDIDAENPATLSRKILTELLREELGYQGPVIADALGMSAVRDSMNQRETAPKAIRAGLDIFLLAGDSVNVETALFLAEGIEQAIESGTLLRSELDASAKRIRTMLDQLTSHPVTVVSDNDLQNHMALASNLRNRQAWQGFDLVVPGFE